MSASSFAHYEKCSNSCDLSLKRIVQHLGYTKDMSNELRVQLYRARSGCYVLCRQNFEFQFKYDI